MIPAAAGRQVRDGADPVAERNRLARNGFGLLVADGGHGRFADNTLAESVTAAVAVTGGAAAELHGTLVQGGAAATGLLVGEGASATATGGEIQGVALAVVASGGAQVRPRPPPAFRAAPSHSESALTERTEPTEPAQGDSRVSAGSALSRGREARSESAGGC